MFKVASLLMTPAAKYLMLAFAILFPLVAANEYQVYVMATAFVWAIAVYGLNIITGFCGQLNLAHGGFFCHRSLHPWPADCRLWLEFLACLPGCAGDDGGARVSRGHRFAAPDKR